MNYLKAPTSGEPMSMLAEANLKAKRQKAPVNFMGTWLMQRTATNGPPPDWEFIQCRSSPQGA